MKHIKYVHLFVGVCLVSMLYGFDTLQKSTTNQNSTVLSDAVMADYQAAIKVNQPKTAEVLAVAKRVIESASKLNHNPLDRKVLENMVAMAFSDEKIEVGQLVDFDVLAQKINAGGSNTRLAGSELLQ